MTEPASVPYNGDAEQAALGACLHDRDAVAPVNAVCSTCRKPTTMYRDLHDGPCCLDCYDDLARQEAAVVRHNAGLPPVEWIQVREGEWVAKGSRVEGASR